MTIVIPNRTKRWFHEWAPGIDLAESLPVPTYGVFGIAAGRAFGSWSAVPGTPEHIDIDLTGPYRDYFASEAYKDLTVAYDRAFGKPPQFPIKVPTPFWT